MTRGKRQTRARSHNVRVLSRLLSIREEVMEHWQREVRARVGGAGHLRGPALTQELPMLFDDIAMALACNERIPNRSHALASESPASHGMERARHAGFGPEQVVYEYQIFRESIAAAAERRVDVDARQWALIDQAVYEAARQALRAFTDIQAEARRKVAAALSHDMRTPLAVIANAAQLISITTSLDLAQKAAVKIESNAARVNDMIGELLNALTFQNGAKLAMKPTRFGILGLVEEVHDQYAQGCHSNVEVEKDSSRVEGYWCRDALRRALENLVNNAVKYGDGGGVQMAAYESGGLVTLSVRNTGNPVPEEHRERIFDYSRRDQNISSAPGWGIGLPFVKAVAEAHGGSVCVQSSAELGTIFLIEIPIDCSPYVKAPKDPGPTNS